MRWQNGRLIITPTKKPKKITGTRFASILGKDRWNSPFKTWCAISRVYEEPFEGNKYTEAGKVLEPKVIQYLRDNVFFSQTDVVSAEDVYGENPFKKTWGDFFKDDPIFGGMWDSYIKSGDTAVAVIEIKATKRAEDWINGAPENYALQGKLYAYKMGCKKVFMVAVILNDEDYDDIENVKVTSDNLIITEVEVDDEFIKMVDEAKAWWDKHVVGGVSPLPDRSRDKEILDAIGATNIDSDELTLLEELEQVQEELDALEAEYASKYKKQKALTEELKAELKAKMGETDTKATVTGKYEWTMTRGVTKGLDKARLEADGLLDKYQTEKESFTLRKKKVEEQ